MNFGNWVSKKTKGGDIPPVNVADKSSESVKAVAWGLREDPLPPEFAVWKTISPPATNFGKWVAKELHKMNKSQEWLMKRTGISSGSIQRWQKGEQPGLDYYLIICSSIARYRGLPVKDVLYQAVREHPILKEGNKK